MPYGTKANELMHFRRTFFSDVKPADNINIASIKKRETKAIFERHSHYPMDYFFFEFEGTTFFGRKTVSNLYLMGQQQIKKCNQITPPMLIGLVVRTQVIEKGVIFFYKPLEANEKMFLFNQFKINSKIDIYFPYPVLDKGLKEHVQPLDVWDPTDDMADELDVGEQHIRQYTINYLSQFNMDGKVVYDPACSTGKFLASIKHAFPKAKTIGQDINAEMIQLAKKRSVIDELHVGTALYPCATKESVDFIFLRFLNLSVISSEQALKIFCKISQCCKVGGNIIVFGFTPVLLSAQIFEILNLEVKQTIAHNQDQDSVFQYYVLQRKGNIHQLRYENFGLFTLSPQEVRLLAGKQQINQDPNVIPRSKL